MPEADETIITRLVVESQDAIEKAKQFRAEVEQTKAQMKAIAAETKASFKDIAQGLKDAFKAEKITDVKNKIADLTANIRNLKNEIKDAAKLQLTPGQVAGKREDLSQAIKDRQNLSSQLKQNQADMQRLNTVTNTATRELTSASQATGLFGGALGGLGNFIKNVFVVALGISTFTIIRNFIQLLQEAIQSSYEFSKAIFQVDIAVRALRRSGIDITAQQVYDNIDKLQKKFAVFSKKELVEGAAAFLNLVRDMNFTRDQIFKLQDAIATLAVVNGRAMDEVQRTVALAISSGYTEGLQRLGVSINRVTIAERAAEMGWEGGYTALTEIQRAQATYNLILEKTAKYQEDLAKYQKTLPGEIDKLSAKWKDQKVIIGTGLLPVQALWNSMLVTFGKILVSITPWLMGQTLALYNLWKVMDAVKFGEVFADLPGAFRKQATAWADARKSMQDFKNSYSELQKAIEEGNMEKVAQIWATAFGDSVDVADKALDTFKINIEDSLKALEDLQTEYADRSKSIELDYQRDLEKIDRDAARRRVELWINYQQRIAEIDRKYQQDLEEARLRYNLDVSQVWEEYYSRVEEVSAKHRDRELNRERDYNEKLKRLQEDFMMDLDEALRRRDARAVLQAIKKYNLEKTRLDRENALAKTKNEEQYKQDLVDSARQRDERLRRLKEEYSLRLKLMRMQHQAELNEALIRYKQEMEDLQRSLQAQKEERDIRRKQELDDLNAYNDEKTKAIIAQIAKEAQLTGIGAENVRKIMEAYFGKTGYVTQIMKAYADFVGRLGTLTFKYSISGVDVTKFGLPTTGITTPPPTTYPKKGKAAGMDVIVPPGYEENFPVYAKTGERVVIVPQNKTLEEFVGYREPAGMPAPISKLTTLPNPPPLGQMAKGKEYSGRLRVELLLSPDLEARIIDKAHSEVAEVVFERARAL